MIIYRYTVITQNVDLFRYLLTAQQTCLKLVYLAYPLAVNAAGDILVKLRIIQIF